MRPGGRWWSLADFTVLAQAAVGTVLFRLVARWWLVDRISVEEIHALIDPALGVALTLLVMGVLVGMLHLERPSRARFALANLRSSWLSRETAFGLLFGLTLAAHVVIVRVDREGYVPALASVDWVFGLAFALQIPRVYRLRTVPTWNAATTSAAFVLTSLVLGPAVVAATLAFVAGPAGAGTDAVDALVSWLALASAVGVALQAFAQSSNPEGERARLVLRYVTAGLGAVLLLVFAWWGRGSRHGGALAAATALLLLSELLGRTLFLARYSRVGL